MTDEKGHRKAGRSFARTGTGNLEVAQLLASRGIPLFPLSADKRPVTPHSFRDAICDASPWQRQSRALAGIPTSSFWVLDIDPPLDVSVQRLCFLLRCEWRDLMAACGCIVRTPRGGFHLYWKRTPGVAIRTVAGDIGAGIDTRGHDAIGVASGYIVAPGCVLPDGRRYQIEAGGLDGLSEATPRMLWLATFSRFERAYIASNADLSSAMKPAPPSAWRAILTAHHACVRGKETRPLIGNGMRRQALHDLHAEQQRLALHCDGRRTAIFGASARLARYVANEVLTASEVEAALLVAWQACGADHSYGNKYARGAIQRALEKGRSDPLPPLMRCFRDRLGERSA